MCFIRYFTFQYLAKNAIRVSDHMRVKEQDHKNTKNLWIVEYQISTSKLNAHKVATSPIFGSMESTISP